MARKILPPRSRGYHPMDDYEGEEEEERGSRGGGGGGDGWWVAPLAATGAGAAIGGTSALWYKPRPMHSVNLNMTMTPTQQEIVAKGKQIKKDIPKVIKSVSGEDNQIMNAMWKGFQQMPYYKHDAKTVNQVSHQTHMFDPIKGMMIPRSAMQASSMRDFPVLAGRVGGHYVNAAAMQHLYPRFNFDKSYDENVGDKLYPNEGTFERFYKANGGRNPKAVAHINAADRDKISDQIQTQLGRFQDRYGLSPRLLTHIAEGRRSNIFDMDDKQGGVSLKHLLYDMAFDDQKFPNFHPGDRQALKSHLISTGLFNDQGQWYQPGVNLTKNPAPHPEDIGRVSGYGHFKDPMSWSLADRGGTFTNWTGEHDKKLTKFFSTYNTPGENGISPMQKHITDALSPHFANMNLQNFKQAQDSINNAGSSLGFQNFLN